MILNKYKELKMIILYRKNKFGGLSTWRISAIGPIVTRFFSINGDGKETAYTEEVQTNQSGRSMTDQVKLVVQSYISRMKDKGYKESMEEAMAGATNQLGLARPMLAQPLKRVRNINYTDAVLQPKLNGHRCLITKQDGELIAYTRQGKIIHTISHILEELSFLPEGETVDGELYTHGQSLQTISSWIKRDQPNNKKLRFVMYDTIRPESFIDRFSILRDYYTFILKNLPNQFVDLLGYNAYVDEQETQSLFISIKQNGFEGLILRTNDRCYEAGIRSNSLIKIKQFLDGEYKVIAIWPSKNGWAVCTCEIPGKSITFDVSAPGTVTDKTFVLDHKDKFIGKQLTVAYSELTELGKPFNPVALNWVDPVTI